MVGRYYFVICGPHDEALFDLDYNSPGKTTGGKVDECLHLNQFVAHAALDMVDDHLWTKADTYLKVVDKFNEWLISAFVTPGIANCDRQHYINCSNYLSVSLNQYLGLRFILLHDELNENRIKYFFQDTYEAYIKLALNPFFERDKPINSPSFSRRVQRIANKHFG
ncbi:Trafficking protein particle complex subunit 2 [Schistosoma japonicum]|nr:Trafficking protein particle complex subunit 2 [Schistosoma japonicum]